ncbi:MAG: RNA methyltransferase [Spirochaetota bacterium]
MKGVPDLANIRIVLVEPRGAFNIGSAARIMKNMGLSDLGLVNPVDFHTDEAYQGAVGARDLLENARVYDSVPRAVGDASLVVGTTRRTGRSRRVFCTVEELPEQLFPVTAGGKAAVLFGREESGLLTSETDLCHLLVRIPSCNSFPSLNLSHAVAVVCYKLFTDAMVKQVPYVLEPADNTEIEGLLDYIQHVFADLGFFSKGEPGYVTTLFRRVFGRALLDREEVRSLTFIFHRLHGLCAKKEKER